MDAYRRIAQLMLDLAAEGIPSAKLDVHEAALVALLSRARTLRQAERDLAVLGPSVAAERLRCHKRTVYKLARKCPKRAQMGTHG